MTISKSLKSLVITLIVPAAIFISFAVHLSHSSAPTAKADGIRLTLCDNVVGQGGAGSKATSTPVFLTSGGATSTMQACNVTAANYFAIAIRQTASSSSSVLDYVVQGSINGIDWYNLDREEALTAGTVTHQATTTDLFSPGVSGVSSFTYTYPNFGLEYVRILYSALGANSSQYISIVPTNAIPN